MVLPLFAELDSLEPGDESDRVWVNEKPMACCTRLPYFGEEEKEAPRSPYLSLYA